MCWRDSRLRGFLVLGWTTANPQKVRIVDYAVEEDLILEELLEAVTGHGGLEVGWMSATLPGSQQRLAVEGGLVPDPSSGPDGKKRFLFFPLTDEPGSVGLTSAARRHSAWPSLPSTSWLRRNVREEDVHSMLGIVEPPVADLESLSGAPEQPLQGLWRMAPTGTLQDDPHPAPFP